MTPSKDISRLIEIMAALRDPASGCPWDLKQTFATIAPYTIEEAYEVADAIARGDLDDLKDELGDLLFAVVNVARKCNVDAESALQDATDKFAARFNRLEDELKARGKQLGDAALEEMDEIWDQIKKANHP